jgi:SSS family solute:Na+ symporter
MAQNFWTAIYAWTTCFLVTIFVSLLTRAPEESKLAGLVYSLTARPDEEPLAWYARPVPLAIMVLSATVLLNIIFW